VAFAPAGVVVVIPAPHSDVVPGISARPNMLWDDPMRVRLGWPVALTCTAQERWVVSCAVSQTPPCPSGAILIGVTRHGSLMVVHPLPV